MGLLKKLFGSLVETPKAQEELNQTNPEGKSLSWFASEAGLEAFKVYTTPQNYILQESIEKEREEKYSEYSLDIVISVKNKDAKLPYVYFKNLINNIKVQPLEYDSVSDMIVNVLCIQAKPYELDEDGEPHAIETPLTPAELVSIEKNPVLNFVSNFNCFLLKDDEMGQRTEKWDLYCSIIFFLSFESLVDKDVISKNQWIFERSTYFNDLGTVRKKKGFLKKAIELSSNRKYFEKELKELE